MSILEKGALAAFAIYFSIAAYGAYWDYAAEGYKGWVTEQIVEGPKPLFLVGGG